MKKLFFPLVLLATLAGCADKQDTPAPATPTAVKADANSRNTSGFPLLDTDDFLLPGDALRSSRHDDPISSGDTRQLVLQGDGNLVLYDTSVSPWRARWNTGTQGRGGNLLIMQADGNLVLYNTSVSPARALWNSGTAGRPGAYFDFGPVLVNGKWRFAMDIVAGGVSINSSGLIKRIYLE